MNKQPISNLIQRMRKTNDEEERKAIFDFVKTAYKATLPKKLEDIPQEVKTSPKFWKRHWAHVLRYTVLRNRERNVNSERNQERRAEMKPVEFPGVNVVFAKDQPEYIPLPAMKVPNDPQGLIITKWQLSPEELERVKETGTIHLSMLTFNQPLQPVLLTVDFPSEQKET